MANAYYYSNTATQTTLTGSVSAGATSLQVGATTGFPVTYPYVLAVDYGATTEELVTVTAAAGTTLTVTRGFSGTSAQSHSIGAVVRHVVNAQDLTDFRTHEASTGAVHGLSGSIVGTSDTQTLSNKTLTNPTINAAALSGTFSGTPTFSGAVTLNGGAALAGNLSGNPTFTGVPVFGAATFNGNVSLASASVLAIGAAQLSRSSGGSLSANTNYQRAATVAGDVAYSTLVGAEAFDRWRTYGDGKQEWGPGTGARDTNLYRSAADTLATDDALAVGGELLVTGANTWTTYTPTVGNAGTATWTTRTGQYWKIGKLVFLRIYLQVNAAGSGASTLTITAPSTIERVTRQVLTVNIEGTGIAGVDGAATLMAFTGGSGAVFDRIRTYDGGSMGGSDLSPASLITIQGWYREA